MLFIRMIWSFLIELSPKQMMMLGAIAAFGSMILYSHHRGYEACKEEQAMQTAKEIKIHDKIENKVYQLSDPDLDKRLAQWMRD